MTNQLSKVIYGSAEHSSSCYLKITCKGCSQSQGFLVIMVLYHKGSLSQLRVPYHKGSSSQGFFIMSVPNHKAGSLSQGYLNPIVPYHKGSQSQKGFLSQVFQIPYHKSSLSNGFLIKRLPITRVPYHSFNKTIPPDKKQPTMTIQLCKRSMIESESDFSINS